MLWALGLLGAARRALAALWALAVRYPLAAALVVALGLSAWLWMGWNRADRKAAAAWAVVAEYKEANAKATAWALAEKAAKEAAATQSKDQANAALKPSLAAGQAATARYVDSHRCLRVAPAEGRGERADLRGSIQPAGQPARPGDDADVAVSVPDINACSVNSTRLDNAYVWGQKMIAAGLAR